MSRIVPIFHDFLGLSQLHFGLSKGPGLGVVLLLLVVTGGKTKSTSSLKPKSEV